MFRAGFKPPIRYGKPLQAFLYRFVVRLDEETLQRNSAPASGYSTQDCSG
jgi:hypothetical protein